MRCNECQEHFVDLLYTGQGTATASSDAMEHLNSCPSCKNELAELKGLQSTLKIWKDEPPLHPVSVPGTTTRAGNFLPSFWSILRYAAIAALVTVAFLGLSNSQIQWDRTGFSFKTSLFAHAPADDVYTKEQVQTILKRVMADTEKANYQMMQQMLDTIDQERAIEYRSLFRQIKEGSNKN